MKRVRRIAWQWWACVGAIVFVGSARAVERSPRIALVRPLAGTKDDSGVAVAETGDVFVISGNSTDAKGRENALLVAVDRNGDERWRREIEGGGDAALWSLHALPDGSLVAAGWERVEKTGLDALVVRVDARGEILWRRSIQSAGDQRLWSVDVVADGILAAGESVANGVTRSLFVRTDLAGNVAVTRAHGEAEVERCFSITALDDGGYVLAGTNGSGPRESAGFDGFVARYRADGTRAWERKIGGAGFDVVHDIVRLADGRFAVAGYGDARTDHGFDVFLARLSANGEVEWRRDFGDGDDDRIVDVEALRSGGYALVGYSRRGESDPDVVVRGTDAEGRALFESRLGGAGQELGRAVLESKDGALIVVGHSRSYAPSERILFARFER